MLFCDKKTYYGDITNFLPLISKKYKVFYTQNNTVVKIVIKNFFNYYIDDSFWKKIEIMFGMIENEAITDHYYVYCNITENEYDCSKYFNNRLERSFMCRKEKAVDFDNRKNGDLELYYVLQNKNDAIKLKIMESYINQKFCETIKNKSVK